LCNQDSNCHELGDVLWTEYVDFYINDKTVRKSHSLLSSREEDTLQIKGFNKNIREVTK
jgi:hypothetical protein